MDRTEATDRTAVTDRTGAGATGLDDRPSDDELCALALAADPGAGVADDAVPLAAYLGDAGSLLPEWYMPGLAAPAAPGWRRPVVLLVVLAFVAIEAAGLCTVFGHLVVG